MSHTPTPWKRNKRASMLIENENRSVASTGGYQDISRSDEVHNENEANAAFIVKAVNNHESLEHAAWLAHEYMKAYLTHYKAGFSVFDELEKAIKEAE